MSVALVTGVTGQDGFYLAELLTGRGTRVVGMARTPADPSITAEGVEFVQGDVTDARFLNDLVESVRPTEIYHLAGQTSVGASFAEPVGTFHSICVGTLNVLEAARRAKPSPRVLVASSGEVFGDLGVEPASETSPHRPRSPYGAAKAAAAQLTAAYRCSYGLHASIAYFYNHESPRRSPKFVTKKIVHAACRIARGDERELALGDVSVVRDFGWAPEYVEAAVRILALDAPEDFVIATGESCSLIAFVEHVFSCLGLAAADHVKTDATLFRAAEIRAMHADPSRAAERLGWRARVRSEDLARLLVETERDALERGAV